VDVVVCTMAILHLRSGLRRAAQVRSTNVPRQDSSQFYRERTLLLTAVLRWTGLCCETLLSSRFYSVLMAAAVNVD